MYYLGLLGISIESTGYAVIKTHTNGNQYITLIGLDIGSQIAVHSQHAHVERMVAGKCCKPQQSTGGGQITLFKKISQFLLCITQFNAVAYQYQRLLGVVYQCYSIVDLRFDRIRCRNITANIINLYGLEFYLLHLGSLGEVKHHGAGTSGTCYIECASHCPGNILGTAYLITPFGDRLGYAHQVDLLESIGTQGIGTYLTGYYHDGGAVKHCIAYACNGVCGTRTAGYDGHTCTARNTCVTLSGVGGSLLMAYQNLAQICAMTVKCIEHLYY